MMGIAFGRGGDTVGILDGYWMDTEVGKVGIVHLDLAHHLTTDRETRANDCAMIGILFERDEDTFEILWWILWWTSWVRRFVSYSDHFHSLFIIQETSADDCAMMETWFERDGDTVEYWWWMLVMDTEWLGAAVYDERWTQHQSFAQWSPHYGYTLVVIAILWLAVRGINRC